MKWSNFMDATLQNKYQKKIITIPNVLSFIRLLMIPFLVWLYYVKSDNIGTVMLLVASGLTDIVDGFIARRFNMISDFGKILDPIADKLTQAVMLFCLMLKYKLMLLPLALLVVKEILAAIMGILSIRRSGEVYSAFWHGKVATALLYLTLGIHVIWFEIPSIVSVTLILMCAAFMLLSSILYTVRNVKIIKGN